MTNPPLQPAAASPKADDLANVLTRTAGWLTYGTKSWRAPADAARLLELARLVTAYREAVIEVEAAPDYAVSARVGLQNAKARLLAFLRAPTPTQPQTEATDG